MQIIDIRGYIVPDEDAFFYRFFGITVTCPKDVRIALEKAAGDAITVRINSYGGDVWSGSEIYTLLRAYEGEVTTEVTGLAASAASVILMAGNMVRASPTAEIMIHNPSSRAEGDYRAMEQAARSLRNTREAIVNAYELKTGIDRTRLRAMMNTETWMTAQSAQADGFADEIMFAEDGKMANQEPENNENGFGNAAAKAAAFSMPCAAELRAKYAVWNEIAPGCISIEEARNKANRSVESGVGDAIENAMQPEEQENETLKSSKDAMEMLRARINTLAV